MSVFYKIPYWFANYDSAIQIFFAITCFLVGLYSYKIYKYSCLRKVKLFSVAFFFMSVSYLIWPLADFFSSSPLDSTTIGVLVGEGGLANILPIYTHILLFLTGLAILAYMSFNIKSKRLYFSLLALSLFPVIAAVKKTDVAYIIASVLIFSILLYYLNIYLERKNTRVFPILFAFFLLFLASLDFIFSDNENIYYVGGHFLMLIAYLLILGKFVINYRKWQRSETNSR